MDATAQSAARAALEIVRDGDTVVSGATNGAPLTLLRAFADRAADLTHVRLAAGLFLTDYSFLKAPAIDFVTWFPPGPRITAAVDAGRIDYLPFGWAQVVDWLTTRTTIDVALVQLGPADAEGYHSFGVSSSYIAPAVDCAKYVIAEVNAQMPVTRGRRVHASGLDAVVHVDRPVPSYPTRAPSAVDVEVARHVAGLIAPGSTLQVGVGAVPDAVLQILADTGVGDLRLHSTLSQGALKLAESGALAAGPGVARVGDILGDADLHAWVHDNDRIVMVDARTTHAARALVEVPQFVSLNSALSVDVYGQVNSEYVDGVHAGAVGGAADFVRAGQWPGNRSIIALGSTARRGTASRIVPAFDGATVSVARDAVNYVVTEYGVADLSDKSVTERRRALAGIAHPSFRSSLEP